VRYATDHCFGTPNICVSHLNTTDYFVKVKLTLIYNFFQRENFRWFSVKIMTKKNWLNYMIPAFCAGAMFVVIGLSVRLGKGCKTVMGFS